MPLIIAAFYQFFDFPHFAEMREPLLSEMKSRHIRGSLLIAPEGINSTICGERNEIDSFLNYLKREIVHGEFAHKESQCESQPFARTKVRLKKETISLGEPTDMRKRGIYVDARQWNALLDDPDVILLDARNDYETRLGLFEGARDPGIRTFKQMPDYVRALDRKAKIATYCTGGIRCEKLTAWMVDQGFEEVYHLDGGILKYLEEVPEADSKWRGECYVFDQRIAVGHGLIPSTTAGMCSACGHSLTAEDMRQASCSNCS